MTKKRNMAAHDSPRCLGVGDCKLATGECVCEHDISGHCLNLYATLDAHRRSAQALELTLSKERCDAYFAAIEDGIK